MKVKAVGSLLSIIVCAMFATACSKSEGPEIATVNGKPIYQSDIDALYKIKGIKNTDSPQAKQLVAAFLEREGLADAITKSSAMDMALVEAEVREFRKELLIGRHMQEYTKKSVSDEAIRNYYQNNQKSFTKDVIKVSHILIRANQNADELERQAKTSQIHSIHSQLLQGGDFAKIAQQKSEDKASAKQGGSLGWIASGAISKEFSDRAFALEPGQISEPFLTNYGFHIIRVDAQKRQETAPYDKVKGDIRFRLRQQAKKDEMERLKKAINIELKD